MSAWIILLFLLANNNFGCGCMNDDRNRRDRDGGCDRDCDRDRDCGCDGDFGRGRNGDCDNNGSRFETRFDARPFADRDRETCGCEEHNK